ncbi:hypothetical protein CVT26_012674 [Gymnopilus dilepis]|uniref:F-box domain-containing protein n=1 Tax=Gymnopilus dilepis TaxID=231916 RepID=A0A409WXW8_9AGAR|nr:hypothetical protein CVT26_012674 [Gymnopilus dilepis]
MSNEGFDPLTVVADILLDSPDDRSRMALRSLCGVSCDTWCYLFHRVYSTIHIRNDRQLLKSFILFVEGNLVRPAKVERLRVSFVCDSDSDPNLFQSALNCFLNSNALQYLELIGLAPEPHLSPELASIISGIISKSARPVTVVCDNVGPVHWSCLHYASHVELRRRSFLAHGQSNLPIKWALQSLSFSTSSGQETFDSMFLKQVELNELSHLLLHVKPSDFDDSEIVDYALTTVLYNNTRLEEIAKLRLSKIVNETASLFCIARTMQSLANALNPISACRRGAISLNIDLRCNIHHAIHVLSSLADLEYFATVSVSITTTYKSARMLLKLGYSLFVAGDGNVSFRVDRRVIQSAQRITTVYGYTIKDDKTLTPAPRHRSHYNFCPWVRRPELGGFDVNWQDSMVPIINL